jgi:hypothetical protein
MTPLDSEIITIRIARVGDGPDLARLAALDSAEIPSGRLLIAEVGGEMRAALSLYDRAVIADPFHRTVELVRLLAVRADLLAGLAGRPAGGRGAWRRGPRLRRRPSVGLARPATGLGR